MSTETHTVADDQVRSAFKRWQNLEEEKARLADDLKELFAEQKALGHDTKAMRAAFRLKVKLDEADPAEAEHEALVDTYLAALEAPRASRAYARENIEQFDANPRLIKQVVDGMQTEAGRAALIAAVDIMIEREEAEETHERPSTTDEPSPEAGPQAEASPAGTGAGTLADREGRSNGEAASADLPTHSEKATVAPQGEATAPTSGDRETDLDEAAEEDRAAANAGGTDVECSAPRAGLADPTSNTGEGAANTALPADGIVMEYVPPTGMKRLPFAGCFPDHSKAEYERLEKDIAASRVRQPIIRQGNVIVDGFARYTIARKYGFAYPVQEYTGNDLLLDLIEWQRAARNFTPVQERKIAAELAKELPHRADDIMAAFGLAEALEDVA